MQLSDIVEVRVGLPSQTDRTLESLWRGNVARLCRNVYRFSHRRKWLSMKNTCDSSSAAQAVSQRNCRSCHREIIKFLILRDAMGWGANKREKDHNFVRTYLRPVRSARSASAAPDRHTQGGETGIGLRGYDRSTWWC
jgi:hypothetical protein